MAESKKDIQISVIIPVYKAEKHIEDCVQSVLEQSFGDFEIILVDDGSPDKSGELCDALAAKDNRIRVIHQQNAGVSAARNRGIKAAEGKYICFLDSDDRLQLNALEVMCEGIGDCDLLIADLKLFAAANTDSTKIERLAGTQLLERCAMNQTNTASACAKLFKSELIKDVEFPEGYRYTEDNFFVFLVATKCPNTVVVDKCVYLIRPNPNSATRSNMDKITYDAIALAQKKHDIIMESFPRYKSYAKHILVKSKLLVLNNLIMAGKLKEALKLRREIIKHKSDFISRGENDDKRFKKLTTGFYGYYLWARAYCLYKKIK